MTDKQAEIAVCLACKRPECINCFGNAEHKLCKWQRLDNETKERIASLYRNGEPISRIAKLVSLRPDVVRKVCEGI